MRVYAAQSGEKVCQRHIFIDLDRVLGVVCGICEQNARIRPSHTFGYSAFETNAAGSSLAPKNGASTS